MTYKVTFEADSTLDPAQLRGLIESRLDGLAHCIHGPIEVEPTLESAVFDKLKHYARDTMQEYDKYLAEILINTGKYAWDRPYRPYLIKLLDKHPV
jgi:hypothetical protein